MKGLKHLLCACLVWPLAACILPSPFVQAAGKILRIGAVFPLTGEAAPGMGPEAADGVRAAADWINGNGGLSLKGEKLKIEIVAEDNRSTTDGTVAAANKLVFNHKVKFICGPIIPWLNLAMTPISEEAKVLRCLVDGTGTPDEMSPKTKYTFAPFFEYPQIPPAYDYLVSNYPEVKKIAIVGPDEPGSHFFAASSKKAAEIRGLEVVHTEFYSFDTKDFYPLLTKILAKKPDAVDIGLGIPPWYAAIIKQGRELGFGGPFYTSSTTPDMPLLINLVGKEYADNFFSVVSSMYSSEEIPSVTVAKKHILAKYSSEVVEAHLGGWSSLWCMAQAIEAAQSLDTTQVSDSWRKMTRIETLNGPGRMGGLEIYGINNVVMKPVALGKVVKGKLEFIGFFPPKLQAFP